MSNNVFISWSGKKSEQLAEAIYEWLPAVLQFAKPYFTPSDIDKGAKWNSEISNKLNDCKVGIICLTKDNLSSPWILFEAGALSKNFESSRVTSVLFGLGTTDVNGPLASFQNTKFNEKEIKKLVESINTSVGGESKLAATTLNTVFKKWWPDLETKINQILEKQPVDKTEEIRTDRELLEEILKLSRFNSRRATEPSGKILPAALRDIIQSTSELASDVLARGSHENLGSLEKLHRAISYLSRKSDDPLIAELLNNLNEEMETLKELFR